MKITALNSYTLGMTVIMHSLTSCSLGTKSTAARNIVNDRIIAELFLEKGIEQSKEVNSDLVMEYMDYITPEFTEESIFIFQIDICIFVLIKAPEAIIHSIHLRQESAGFFPLFFYTHQRLSPLTM